MENKIKVGDTARVFEVVCGTYGEDIKGQWAIEAGGRWRGSDIGVDLYVQKSSHSTLHFGINKGRENARHVASLVVTKVK